MISTGDHVVRASAGATSHERSQGTHCREEDHRYGQAAARPVPRIHIQPQPPGGACGPERAAAVIAIPQHLRLAGCRVSSPLPHSPGASGRSTATASSTLGRSAAIGPDPRLASPQHTSTNLFKQSPIRTLRLRSLYIRTRMSGNLESGRLIDVHSSCEPCRLATRNQSSGSHTLVRSPPTWSARARKSAIAGWQGVDRGNGGIPLGSWMISNLS